MIVEAGEYRVQIGLSVSDFQLEAAAGLPEMILVKAVSAALAPLREIRGQFIQPQLGHAMRSARTSSAPSPQTIKPPYPTSQGSFRTRSSAPIRLGTFNLDRSDET